MDLQVNLAMNVGEAQGFFKKGNVVIVLTSGVLDLASPTPCCSACAVMGHRAPQLLSHPFPQPIH